MQSPDAVSLEDIYGNAYLDEYVDSRSNLNNLLSEYKSRKIARNGDYFAILEKLEESGLFYEQIDRVQSLVDFDFFRESDWKMATILELFDQQTFEHSFKTYQIAREKVDKHLGDGVIIANIIKKEGISMKQFYRACMFHDIGKVEVPHFILNNRTTETEWTNRLFELVSEKDKKMISKLKNLGFSSDDLLTIESLRNALRRKGIRPVKIVPVKEVLPEVEIKTLEQMGFSGDMALSDILQLHEEMSEEILQKSGMKKEGLIAGSHHNYRGQAANSMVFPVSTTSLSISLNLSDVLHLADVQQALEQIRPYKPGRPKLEVLRELSGLAKAGLIDEYITRLWVSDEMDKVLRTELDDVLMQDNIKEINSFLNS